MGDFLNCEATWQVLRVTVRRICLWSAELHLVWRELRNAEELRRLAALERLRRQQQIAWIPPWRGRLTLLGRPGTLSDWLPLSCEEALQRFGADRIENQLEAAKDEARRLGILFADCKADHIRFDLRGQLFLLDSEGWGFPSDRVSLPPPSPVPGPVIPALPRRKIAAAKRMRSTGLWQGLGVFILVVVAGCGTQATVVCPALPAQVRSLTVQVSDGASEENLWQLPRESPGTESFLELPRQGSYQLAVTGYEVNLIPVYSCHKTIKVEAHESLVLSFAP